jgi:hypothetical protein
LLIFLAITPLKSSKNAAEYREKGRARKGSGAYQRMREGELSAASISC